MNLFWIIKTFSDAEIVVRQLDSQVNSFFILPSSTVGQEAEKVLPSSMKRFMESREAGKMATNTVLNNW